MIPCIINDDGITVVLKSKSYFVTKDDVKYDSVLKAWKNNDDNKLLDLLTIKIFVETVNKKLDSDNFVIKDGHVFIDGVAIDNVVCEKILGFYRDGLPILPLVRFLRKLLKNPSFNSRKMLYRFLEHGKMPITENGNCIGYKGITRDYKDKWTGKLDYSIGSIHEMDRGFVCDDISVACAPGFHIGTIGYAKGWAGYDGRVVLVEFSPEDAVAVPRDHNFEKLRCCKMKILAEYESDLEGDLYRTTDDELVDYDADNNSDDCYWDNHCYLCKKEIDASGSCADCDDEEDEEYEKTNEEAVLEALSDLDLSIAGLARECDFTRQRLSDALNWQTRGRKRLTSEEFAIISQRLLFKYDYDLTDLL